MGCLCSQIRQANRDLARLASADPHLSAAITEIGVIAQRLATISVELEAGVYAVNIGETMSEVQNLHVPLGRAAADTRVQHSGAQNELNRKLLVWVPADAAHHAAMAAERAERNAGWAAISGVSR